MLTLVIAAVIVIVFIVVLDIDVSDELVYLIIAGVAILILWGLLTLIIMIAPVLLVILGIGVVALIIWGIVTLIKRVKKRRTMVNFTCTCPYCYEEHRVADCGLKCSINIGGKTNKKCKHNVKKYDDQYGNDWIPQVNYETCFSCKETALQLYCMDMMKEIPLEYFKMESLPIALLGAKASGKSNYIGVLVNEIHKKMTSPFNCSLSMTCSQESYQAYKDLYYGPLYEKGITVSATDAGVEVPPLIFPLKFMDAKSNIINMAALTFYDTAGENLDNRDIMLQFNHYITNAHGIIMLLDPLQVPNIRDKLTANGFNALPAQNTEIDFVLSKIIELIREVKKIEGQIQIPLALVFTKIDVLEQYNILPERSCLKEESGHIKRGAFVKADFENTNIEMRDLIENWLDAGLIGYIKQFKSYSFFGITALGGNPTGSKLDSKGIRPRRVLDPLLWLLAEKRYIQTLKK